MHNRAGLLQAFTLPLICLSIVLLGCNACGNDQPKEEGPSLEGKWNIERTLRNGRPTESADDLYFSFGPEERIETNVSSSPETGTYQLEENTITTEGISLLTSYEIVSLDAATLVLRSAAGNYRFEFLLRRTADQTDDPALEAGR